MNPPPPTVDLYAHLGVLSAPQLILSGKTTERGVISPMSAEWYEPILHSLKGEGVEFRETVTVL